MAEDTTTVETVTPAAPSNEPGTTPAPVTDNKSSDELEAARKEAEQAKMRANQLANQLAEKEKAETAARQKQLEEKEEFKTLYEQTQSRLKEIEEAQAAQERQEELKEATEIVFKDYPANVVEVAKTAGLSLSDDSEASRVLLKEKLDAIKDKVPGSPTPRANNPHSPAPAAPEKTELVNRMRNGDESATREYIRNLPSIQRMKELANGA